MITNTGGRLAGEESGLLEEVRPHLVALKRLMSATRALDGGK